MPTRLCDCHRLPLWAPPERCLVTGHRAAAPDEPEPPPTRRLAPRNWPFEHLFRWRARLEGRARLRHPRGKAGLRT